MLSPQAQELIAKAQIVSFESWYTGNNDDWISIFEEVNRERRYLSDEDFRSLETQLNRADAELQMARRLRDRASELVDRSRSQVLARFPEITQPGGKLYPEKRAENCWRDFWHFLRCIHYGIAGKNLEYLSAEGLHYMDLLYQELDVPLDAMLVGLEALREVCLAECAGSATTDYAPYFDRLIESLKGFSGYTKLREVL
ncbi:hypothetical protein [Roseofilum casamattae]|nr:hypothetical protein [Roseofilum casamattae]